MGPQHDLSFTSLPAWPPHLRESAAARRQRGPRPSPGNSIRTWNKYLLIHTMIISYHDYTANNIYFFHSAAVEVQASCCHALRTENRQADVVSQVCYRRPWPWSSLRCKALITPRTNKPGVLMRITHCSCHNWRCSIEIVSMAANMLKELGSIQAFLVERLKQEGRQRGAGSKCMLPQQTMKRTASIHRDDCARHALGCNVVGVETQQSLLLLYINYYHHYY